MNWPRASMIVVLASTLLLSGCVNGAGTRIQDSDPSMALRQFRLAVIDGQSSGRAWLSVAGQSLVATGYTGGTSWTIDTPSGLEYGLEFLVPELVGPMTLYHSIPVYLSRDSEVTVDGTPIDPMKLTTTVVPDNPPVLGFASVRFRLDDSGRATVESLTVSKGQDLPDSVPQGSLPDVGSAPDANPEDPWLSIRQGEAVRLEAYPGGSSSTSGDGMAPSSRGYYYVPDRLGNGTIFHVIAITDDSNDGMPVGREVPISFSLKASEFVPAE